MALIGPGVVPRLELLSPSSDRGVREGDGCWLPKAPGGPGVRCCDPGISCCCGGMLSLKVFLTGGVI